MEVDVAIEARAILGEGPLWDPDEAVLIWVDIMGHLVHRYDPERDADQALDVGRPVGAAALRRDGGLVLAVEDGFATVDSAWEEVELIAPLGADDSDIRFNDGACDPAGRFWAGTMAYDFSESAAALYRLDPDHTVHRILSGVTISNGLAWSPDRETMYYIDSPTQGVDAFAYEEETGHIEDRRRVVEISQKDGLPDGMTIDAQGYLWVALWGGGKVRRYTPDGGVDQEITLPVSQVTSCAFGGPDLGDLYVTSAREGLKESQLAEQPLAGSVFRCRPGVTGIPAFRFAG